LGVAKYIVDNSLYDAPYVKEQTDLPLLVDKRTNRFVRAEGATDLFFFQDAKTGQRHGLAIPPAWSDRSRAPAGPPPGRSVGSRDGELGTDEIPQAGIQGGIGRPFTHLEVPLAGGPDPSSVGS
jgi:hypothetical protein